MAAASNNRNISLEGKSLNAKDAETVLSEFPASEDEENYYPKGIALYLIMSATWSCILLVALDRTILATALPKITDQFNSQSDVGWYGSSYMLTNCSVQLVFGRIYKFYNIKWILLTCIGIFEVGSALCGAAPDSVSLIVGRSIAGLGAAGIHTGCFIALFHTVPLHKRPLWAGLFGATYGVASIIGPLLGGIFTDKATWRWCFLMNLPIGAFSFVVILFIFRLPQPVQGNLTLRQQLQQLDPLGTFCFLPSMVSLLLALQWGGSTYDWSSWRIILLLTLFSVLIVGFGVIQVVKGDSGTLPPRILTNRSIAAGAYFTFCMTGSMVSIIYYIPIWFQAVKGTSALQSGIHSLPMILSLALAGIVSGRLTSRIGYFVPSMILCSVLASVGAGLLTTLDVSSGPPAWIGYQVLFGTGLGVAMQINSLTAQAVLPKEDVPIGTAIMFFSQQLGGAIFVSVGQSIFINDLVSRLTGVADLSAFDIVSVGVTDLQRSVPTEILPIVLEAYNHASTRTFVIATGMIAASIVGSLAMKWTKISKERKLPKAVDFTEKQVEQRDEVKERTGVKSAEEIQMCIRWSWETPPIRRSYAAQ